MKLAWKQPEICQGQTTPDQQFAFYRMNCSVIKGRSEDIYICRKYVEYKDGLRKLNLLLLTKIRLWQDPTDIFKYLKGYCREDGTRHFSEVQKAKVQ